MRYLACSLMLLTLISADVARGQNEERSNDGPSSSEQPAAVASEAQPETPRPALGDASAAEDENAAQAAFAQPPARQDRPEVQNPPEAQISSEAQPLPKNSSIAPSSTPYGERSASAAQTSNGDSTPSQQLTAEQLIATLAKPPRTGQLVGAPLSLADAVRDAATRTDQTQRVEAYWDLAAAVADYHLARRETTELAALEQSVTTPSRKWDSARSGQETRLTAARRTAQAAQFRLQELLGDRNGRLPLPADLPCCEPYNTKYDAVFASNPAPAAEQLDGLLTLRCEELQTQAAAVNEAYDWLALVSQRRSPDTDGEGLLRAHDLLSLRRRAFLFTVRDYNQKIAQYAELARPQRLAVDRLVAMHIGDPNATLARSDSNLRRASATESFRNEVRRPIDKETQAKKPTVEEKKSTDEQTKKEDEPKSVVVKPETNHP